MLPYKQGMIQAIVFLLSVFSALGFSHPGSNGHKHPSRKQPVFDVKKTVAGADAVFLGGQPATAAKYDWYTSDMHIHATGCRPEANPTSTTAFIKQNLVSANTNVGDILIWGDQKSYILDAPNFRGAQDDPLSDATQILHWDLEVSQLPGSVLGHQTFLNLSDLGLFKSKTSQPSYPNYPGKNYLLPNYAWAQAQGALVGYPHAEDWDKGTYYPNLISSAIAPRALPWDIVSERVDFLATEYINHPNHLWLWYSMLNAGFHIAPAAGSDYPCFEGKIGRVQTAFPLPKGSKLTFASYIDAIRSGRTVVKENPAEVSDSANGSLTTAYLDMRVADQPLGSEITLNADSGTVKVEVDASGSTGNKIGIVKNGEIVATAAISPTVKTYTFNVAFEKSGWLAALTVDAHTAATFVLVNGCDIRLDPAGARKWANYVNLLPAFGDTANLFGADKTAALASIERAAANWRQIAGEGEARTCIPRSRNRFAR